MRIPSEKRLAPALWVLLAVLFLIANRGAFKSYFQNDELDNLSFTREIGLKDFLVPLAVPNVFDDNFRPVGHLFFRLMGQTAWLNFPAYIWFIQVVHLLNAILLWLVLRRLGAPFGAACAGVLFWAVHMAAFDVYWAPMYVFDLLCGTCCLLSLLAYVHDRWILSLLAMWIGYRCKEVVIMLPVALAGYEFLLAQRRWKRLIPFFALSLILGLQAIYQNHNHPETAYTLHLTARTLWECISYYASKVFLIPYAGFLLILLLFSRDRRVLFGVLTFGALLVPMLLLPGRLFSAYLYVPMVGLSIALAALAEKTNPALVALFFVFWLPWNFVNLRRDRNVALSGAPDRRAFVASVRDFAQRHPQTATFIYDHGPFLPYGAEAAVKLSYPLYTKILFTSLDDPKLKEALEARDLAVLSWDNAGRKPLILERNSAQPDASYLKMDASTPIWQLDSGWYPLEGKFRWTKPEASAHIHLPEAARRFELVVNIGPRYIEQVHRSRVEVLLDGTPLGAANFDHAGWQTVHWDLPPHLTPGDKQVTIRTSPDLNVGRQLGTAVGALGFIP